MDIKQVYNAVQEIMVTNYGEVQCHEETMRIAAEALKKQLPKAVEKTDDFPQCPNCGSHHIYYAEEEHRHEFCPYCGQRLKW